MVRNLNWPTIEKTDPLGDALKGFQEWRDYGRNVKNEQDAPAAFEAYLDSLYGGGSAPTGGAAPAALDLAALETTRRGGAGGAAPAVGDIAADYFAATRASESAGNDNAKNANSSATGRYQFIDGTWSDLMAAHPELGLTIDGRTDPAQQERAMRAFTADNARALKGAGLGVDPGSLYAAHFLGAGGATKVLQGDPNSPVSAYVSPEVITANPDLANMTVGQFKNWAASKGGNSSGGYSAPTMNTGMTGAAPRGLPPREAMMALFRNPVTRPLAIEAIKTAQAGGIGGKPTDDMQEYMFALQQGYKGSFFDWQKTKTGPQIINNNGTGATSKFYDQLDQKLAEQTASAIEAGWSARSNAVRLGELGRLLETIPQGATGGMVQLAGALGISLDAKAGDVQAAQAIINQMVPQQRPPGSGTMSDADLALFKQSLPSILNQPDGNQKIMTLVNAINEYTIAQADIAQMVANREIDPAEGRRRQAAVPNPLASRGDTKKKASEGDGAPETYPEGTVIQNDAGKRMIMRNGEWVDYNGQ